MYSCKHVYKYTNRSAAKSRGWEKGGGVMLQIFLYEYALKIILTPAQKQRLEEILKIVE